MEQKAMDTSKMQEILSSLRRTIESASENVPPGGPEDPVLKATTATLMAGMKSLLEAYAEGVTKMTTLIVQTEHDEPSLRKAVEDVASGLEGSIEDFRKRLSPRLINRPIGQLPPNVGQIISAVIEYTEQSTMRTIGFMNELDEIRVERVEWQGKLKEALSPTETKKDQLITAFAKLTKLEERYQVIHCKMLENQSFQDLTGQALQLLVWLVNSVEASLRQLAADSGIKFEPRVPSEGESAKKELGDQADIDALMATLE
jgi:hypothetical protein